MAPGAYREGNRHLTQVRAHLDFRALIELIFESECVRMEIRNGSWVGWWVGVGAGYRPVVLGRVGCARSTAPAAYPTTR